MRIYLDQLRQLLSNFASYCIAMPKPEDEPSKKRKNSASDLAQHEPAQKKKPSESIPATAQDDTWDDMPPLAHPEPDDEIPAFLKNVPLETLMKAVRDRKEPTTYQGVVYEHDDILGDTWLNDADAIFVPFDENNLRCHTCGTTVAKDMLMDHTCPASFKLKRGAATETMTLSEDDHLRRLNHNLAREELESMESDKFLTATTHTKSHTLRRAKIQQQLLETIVT